MHFSFLQSNKVLNPRMQLEIPDLTPVFSADIDPDICICIVHV